MHKELKINLQDTEWKYDYIDHVVNIKPVWIFIKESLFNDRKPFYDSIIIDALTGNKYE